jgi:hypothetical protein
VIIVDSAAKMVWFEHRLDFVAKSLHDEAAPHFAEKIRPQTQAKTIH